MGQLAFKSLDLANIAMIYLAGVVVSAFWLGRGPSVLAAIVGVAAVCFVFFLAIGFVHVCTRDFVVPLMAVHDENVTQAWSRFGALLSAHPGDFVAYALMLVLLEIVVGLAVVAAGLLTCCVGFVLMMLPYIGSLVRLPLCYTRRGIGPLFLQQYGPEWRVMPPLDAALETPTPVPPPATY